LGCGDGRILKLIAPITKKIFGVDYDETAIEHAKKNLIEIPSVKIIQANEKNIPFEDKSFDMVLCIDVFHNFGEDKQAILDEMKRVLKIDGEIILSVYSEDALEERITAYKKVEEKINGQIKEIRKDGTVIFDDGEKEGISEQFSKKQLILIFKKSNLEIIEIKKVGIGYLCKLSKQQTLKSQISQNN